jgi:predicted HAD superfamily Cof-like phosphohydrolase
MKEQINNLKEFNEAFKIDANDDPQLRYELMAEENDEYLEACENEDKVEIADALGDMLYILCGTIINHGMENVIEEVFKEIHRSNMSKLGPDGKPMINGFNIFNDSKPMGKILKGPNYSEPNIQGVLDGTYKPFKRYVKING